jgi:hypothetical protein
MELTRITLLVSILAVSSLSRAEAEPHASSQLQLDLGLSVIHAHYEHPLGDHVALSAGGGIFGTYFLPWFDLGDEVVGAGFGLRATWFRERGERGLYLTPYLRGSYVSGNSDGMEGTGIAVTAGTFVGWCFGLSERFDLRAGLGAQYIYIAADPLAASTPFVGIDLLVGYRLQ